MCNLHARGEENARRCRPVVVRNALSNYIHVTPPPADKSYREKNSLWYCKHLLLQKDDRSSFCFNPGRVFVAVAFVIPFSTTQKSNYLYRYSTLMMLHKNLFYIKKRGGGGGKDEAKICSFSSDNRLAT